MGAHDVLRVAAAVGLPGTPRHDPPPEVTTDVLAIAGNHRVQGLVCAALDAGVVTAADEVAEQARERHLRALRGCLLAEETTLLALEALGGGGVDARVLKGPAIAHLDHDDPAERIFGDADVLIRRHDHRRALAALLGAGFRRRMPAVRGWWERRYGRTVVLYAPNDGELDLHLSIAGGYFGARLSEDDLWSRVSEPFDLGGLRAVALDREDRLLHACCHKVLGGSSGVRVTRDVAQLALVAGADWNVTVDRATAQGVDLVVTEAVRSTWATFGLDPAHPLAAWAATHSDDPTQRRALAAYAEPDSAGWAAEGRSTLAALGRLDRVAYLAGLAMPSRASLQARGRTWRAHLRDGWRVVRAV